jgi:crotonobetainyl-CoA:carnitine CoA-transferase CaiB-like acyl-CoA transferase
VYETFATSDRKQIFIGVTSNAHWESFCRALHRADLLDLPEFSDNNKRVVAKDTLIPIVAQIVSKHSFDELAMIFERESIPFSPVAKPGDLFEDEQLNARGWLERTELVTGEMTKLPGIPLEFADHKLGLRHQPPQLGEHTDEILKELGLPPN